MTTLQRERKDAPVSVLERAAYERHERDMLSAANRGWAYREDMAARAITFIERYLKHATGEWAGTNFKLTAWQRFIISSIFGWYRSDGTRRFRRAYVQIPRKNGKSTLAAAIALYMTAADGEQGAEVYCAATTREQARIVFDAASNILGMSPALRRYVAAQKNNIYCKRTGGIMRPVSSQAKNLDGLNAHCIIIDELHAHRSRELYDVLATSMGARRQPLLFMITTAGVYEPEKIGFQQYTDARNILTGSAIDEETFVYIATIDESDDWRTEAAWSKANPNYDVTVRPSYLAQLAMEAQRTPSFQNTFRRLHLDEWTQQVTRWIDMEQWDASAGAPAPPAPMRESLKGRACWGGLDLATVNDLAALVLVFHNSDNTVDTVCRFYCPERGVLARSQRDKVPYDAWARDGWLVSTPGDTVDTDFIREDINALAEYYDIRRLSYDRWGMATLSTQLAADGVVVAPLTQSRRALHSPTMELERLIVDSKLRHGANPIMRWMAGNVALASSGGYSSPSKEDSTEKIDGIIALVMAVYGMVDELNAERSGVWSWDSFNDS